MTVLEYEFLQHTKHAAPPMHPSLPHSLPPSLPPSLLKKRKHAEEGNGTAAAAAVGDDRRGDNVSDDEEEEKAAVPRAGLRRSLRNGRLSPSLPSSCSPGDSEEEEEELQLEEAVIAMNGPDDGNDEDGRESGGGGGSRNKRALRALPFLCREVASWEYGALLSWAIKGSSPLRLDETRMLKSLTSRLQFRSMFVESPLELTKEDFIRVCDNAGTISEGGGLCYARFYDLSVFRPLFSPFLYSNKNHYHRNTHCPTVDCFTRVHIAPFKERSPTSRCSLSTYRRWRVSWRYQA